MKNPLRKRIPRELLGDWRKYLVVSLFLILTIGFVSGMYVANESMMTSARAGVERYLLEDGHFELDHEAEQELLAAIETGEKADVLQFYLDRAKEELDGRFAEEFDAEFARQFDAEFAEEFDAAFEEQIRESLLTEGLPQAAADAMIPAIVDNARESGDYDEAYETAYEEAYEEAYATAYEEAWAKIRETVMEEYESAKERYELDDPDFAAVPVKVYANAYRNEEEDADLDGAADGTVRVFARTEEVNLACLMDGRFPRTAGEIAIDRMHADNAGIVVGDTIGVGGESYEVVGLIAYVNYATLHEKNTDLIFDAIRFDVAMVTEEGFERLHQAVHYNYAWKYVQEPADEQEEKRLSDDFLKALLTQTVTGENEMADYIPRYANAAVNFAADDMGSDEAMGGVLLDILIVIIAFIFAVTISNTIAKESQTIGTLRASGYTRGELIRHYLAMPVIVTLIAAAAGNALGYSVFKYVVVSMYYNSYSLPAYETVWNPEAFYRTTLIPVILMFVVNLAVITRQMRRTPLQFLRRELKKTGRRKAMRLPDWSFFGRFRLRIIAQNIPNYVILFFGVSFVMVMLAMAVGLPDTLQFYQEHIADMMFADYQYVLKSYEDGDGEIFRTEQEGAEMFGLYALQKTGETLDEEVSVYGIVEDSRYVEIEELGTLEEGEVFLSEPFADKYSLKIGDTVTLDEKYESRQYQFVVAGIYGRCQSIAVFMPIGHYRAVFGLGEEEFSGYLSDTPLSDLDGDAVATVITEHDITKMSDQLDHSMGAYMQYFQILCILLSAVLIYLLTKIIIEKNETAISMVKILGYENGEIARLYLLSTTIVLLLADAAGVWVGVCVMTQAWRAIMLGYTGWFTFHMEPSGYVKMFAFVLIGYLAAAALDFWRIRKIPLDEALKNVE